MKRTLCFSHVIFVVLICLLNSNIYAEENYTLADVSTAQEDNSAAVETLSMTMDTETKVGDQTQLLSYEYIMQKDTYGNVKTMITTLGIFTMQFLVDTSDMSVTYMMASGKPVKYKLTEEELKGIQQMAGISGVMGGNSIKTMYALASGKKITATDAVYASALDTDTLETADHKISVDRKRSNKNEAYVEYVNKNTGRMRAKWDESLKKLQNSRPDNAEGEKLKQKALKLYNGKRDQTMKTLLAKRVEKIDMKTGIVNEQEMFNDNNERIGWFKISKKSKFRPKKQSALIRKALKSAQAAGANAAPAVGFAENAPDEIEMPVETEGEMDSAEGRSRFRTKYRDIKVNDEVEFRWMDVKNMKKQ